MARKHGDQKIERLSQVALFEHANKKALRNLAQAADELHIPAGKVLIEEGHRHHEVHIITDGTATVEIHGDDVAEVGAGEVVGELALFCHSAASGTVRAKTDLDILTIPFGNIRPVLLENPDLSLSIASILAGRLLDMDRRYSRLAHPDEG